MKILHTVELYHPSVGGMQEVVKQLSEQLFRLGHDMTVATTKLPSRGQSVVNGVRIKDFSISGNLARGVRGDVEAYREFLLNSEFDVITNFAAQQWATDVMIDILGRITAKKVFVPTGFSGLHDRNYTRYYSKMPAWMKQYDMNVFLSEGYQDVTFARENGVKKCVIIPNGASEDEFLSGSTMDIRSALRIPPQHFLILHVGSHTGMKGHQEAIKIFKKARISDSTFLMIANDVSKACSSLCKVSKTMFNCSLKRGRDGKKIIVASFDRPETIAAYHSADLFLFPSNVECSPLVLFECMASKTPFLTTDVGNAAEIVKWSRGGMLLPTTKNRGGYSKAVINDSTEIFEKICKDASLRGNMAENGFLAWKDRFTWSKIASQYEQLYDRLSDS